MFLILFVFKEILKNKKNIYIFVFILLIISFIFGASFNNYFRNLDPTHSFLEFKEFVFPTWTFPVSLLFPLYAPGQIIYVTFRAIVTNNGERWESWIKFLTDTNILQWVPINSVTGINAINWDIVLIEPAIWTLILLVISLFTSKLESKKNIIN